MDRKDLDSPCRELSNGGLESVVTLLVRWQIDYSTVPQLHNTYWEREAHLGTVESSYPYLSITEQLRHKNTKKY